MPDRERLPNKRSHEVFDLDHANVHYVVGLGRFPDGRLAEVFLDAGKPGSPVQIVSRDAAMLTSMLLQYGVPAAAILETMTKNPDGSAAGPIGCVLEIYAEGEKGA